ncbi:MAG TPA: putative glycoside hydrolase, partial [Spirochaetota bacterium]|nr:putative glycoside hydrolase [Spirochaetota bacterium]
KEVLRILKINGFYTVARIAVFRDHLLAETDPSLAIQSARGGVWNRGEKEIWCDPTNRKVQDYNIALAAELCSMGADEIQFDYIRFPTVGNQSDARYRNDFGAMGKQSVIAHFLKRARREISSRNALVSIDIFGVVAWGKEVDIRKTGQQIGMLASNCDVISPMLYPSHFNDDFDGFANPGDNPYYFIYNGCRRVIELSGKKAAVRPWLQAFKWRVSRYDSSYVIKQIQASDDSGAMGYLFWNAANNYGEVLEAMDMLQKARAAGPGKASAEKRVN